MEVFGGIHERTLWTKGWSKPPPFEGTHFKKQLDWGKEGGLGHSVPLTTKNSKAARAGIQDHEYDCPGFWFIDVKPNERQG